MKSFYRAGTAACIALAVLKVYWLQYGPSLSWYEKIASRDTTASGGMNALYSQVAGPRRARYFQSKTGWTK